MGRVDHVRIPMRFEDLQGYLLFPYGSFYLVLVLFISTSLPPLLLFKCSCITVTVGTGFAFLYLFTWTAWEKSI